MGGDGARYHFACPDHEVVDYPSFSRWSTDGGVLISCMVEAQGPLHPYNAGTKHVGFPLARPTTCEPSAKCRGCSMSRMNGELHSTKTT